MSKNWDCLNKNNPEKTAVGKTGGTANTWCPRAKSKPSDKLSVNKSGDSVDASQCKKVLHIIIPIAGTSDPVNKDDINSRAVSYSAIIDGKEIQYWDKCFVRD